MTEQEIINIISRNNNIRSDVLLGIGDDAAITALKTGKRLVCAIDSLIENVHFLSDIPPHALGHRALAVNLSDLSAMGANPTWYTLSLSVPQDTEKTWFEGFSRGMTELANQYNMQLIGGDLCHGPSFVTIQAMGNLPMNRGLYRSGAKVGDDIYVVGYLGQSALGLKVLMNELSVPQQLYHDTVNRFYYPQPQIELGQQLLSCANSAVDISDGLLNDLGLILQQSGELGATLYAANIPVCPLLTQMIGNKAFNLALTHGDDYQLCFTASRDYAHIVDELASEYAIHYIGTIEQHAGIRFQEEHITVDSLAYGYHHFGQV
jgi:thiamine-monophosphate kinase